MSDLRVVVAGAGRVGFQTAQTLDDRGHSVVVVEQDEARCRAVSDEYVATVIEGDATDPSILEQADVESADAVAALTGQRGINLGVALLAERMADVYTVVRVDSTQAASAYASVVDDVVFPERLGALGAVNAIARGSVRALEDQVGDLQILEMRVAEEAPVANRTLDEVSLPRGSLVVSAADGDHIARADMELLPDRTYVVAVEPSVLEEVQRLFVG